MPYMMRWIDVVTSLSTSVRERRLSTMLRAGVWSCIGNAALTCLGFFAFGRHIYVIICVAFLICAVLISITLSALRRKPAWDITISSGSVRLLLIACLLLYIFGLGLCLFPDCVYFLLSKCDR